MAETWREVTGLGGLYEVSDHGRVRSLHKGVRILKPGRAGGHHRLILHYKGVRHPALVHRLVLEAFAGPCPEGREGCHRDDDPDNNHIDNLYWGTRSDNIRDQVRNGLHGQARKTHCSKGHPYNEGNTRTNERGHRICAECRRQSSRVAKKRDWEKYQASRQGFVNHRHLPKERCYSGRHRWDEQEPVVNKKTGQRTCRPCRDERLRTKGTAARLNSHCRNGHEFDAENTYYRTRDGQRRRACRACQRARNDRLKERMNAA